MNELIKNINSRVVIIDPLDETHFVAVDDFDALIASANERVKVRREQLLSLGEPKNASTDDLRKLLKECEADDAALKGFADNYTQAIIKAVGLDEGLKRFRVQTKGATNRIDALSARGRIGEVIKTIRAELDARKPKAPAHTYVMQFQVTDAQLKTINALMVKLGVQYRYAAPQSDKAFKVAEQWFRENM